MTLNCLEINTDAFKTSKTSMSIIVSRNNHLHQANENKCGRSILKHIISYILYLDRIRFPNSFAVFKTIVTLHFLIKNSYPNQKK